MGWQDRDYSRSYGDAPGFGGRSRRVIGPRWTVTTQLIVANVAIFVICTLTGGKHGPPGSPLFQWTALHSPFVLRGEIWRLITANYLHWGVNHILMNMLGLYFLGMPLERDWGRKRFLFLYTVAGLFGSLFYLILTRIGWLDINGVAAGASGCVLGLLGACAVRYPGAEMLVYFIIPIKIRTMAMLFGGWYVLNLYVRGPNAGGDACHLAGLIYGVWWAMRGNAWWSQLSWSWPVKPFWKRTAARRNFATRWEERRVDEEAIDRILKKVGEYGIHSLSEMEKDTLRAATDRQKQRDDQAGRLDRL